MVQEGAAPLGAGGRAFQRLGRSVVRHPYRPVVLWVVLLVLAVPLLLRVGSATQNSASQVPSSSPSSVAAAEMARLFPGSSAPSSSLLLFTGADISGPDGQRAVLNVTAALAADPRLVDVGGIASLYASYGQYLGGEANLSLAVVGAVGIPLPALEAEAGNLSAVLWGPPSAYFAAWEANVSSHPGTPAASWNYPVYAAISSGSAPGSDARQVLDAFYDGVGPTAPGFNASASRGGAGGCALDPSTAPACANLTAAGTGREVLPAVLGANASPEASVLGEGVLGAGSTTNLTSVGTEIRAVVLALALGSGLSAPLLSAVVAEFPVGTAAAGGVAAWASAVADGPVASYPVPIPRALRSQFLAPGDSATLVLVSFTVSDSTTTASGANPVFNDVAEIDRIVPPTLLEAAPGGSVGYVQTGPAPLDADENTVLSQNLSIVLPLTIAILVVITILYFRSPLAPAVTFGGLGVAVGLALASLVLVSMAFGKVDPTAITLENTFVLGVGTDYSIFLVARYREELRKGVPSNEAVVTSVTWAGQSIATSGGTAVLATLALAFSGVGLLSQWGETLSAAIAITVLVALTLVPALLTLLGPRVFWPETGAKAVRAAALSQQRLAEGRTYFHRAGRLAQRRPVAIIAVILLVTVPLGYVALTAPLSYDFYQQLPASSAASTGLAKLSDNFGPGYAFPTLVLMTFPSPLLEDDTVNLSEFGAIADVTTTVNATPGVASVASPVGPSGATLAAWVGYATAPAGTQAELSGVLESYVGTDGRTVLLTVVPASSGLATASIQLLTTLKSAVGATLARDDDSGVQVRYGGGAAVTTDLAAQTALATDRMFLAVSIGLLVVLGVVLRSWLIPPLAVLTIILSIGWAWGLTQLVFVQGLGLSLFFFVPTVLFILILGLGIDYNIFLLTRVREERLRGRSSRDAALEAVARTGGIITAAAIILGGAFAALSAGDFVLLKAIGFSVATAVILDAMVVRTYLVPSALQLLGDRVWTIRGRGSAPPEGTDLPAPASPAPPP